MLKGMADLCRHATQAQSTRCAPGLPANDRQSPSRGDCGAAPVIDAAATSAGMTSDGFSMFLVGTLSDAAPIPRIGGEVKKLCGVGRLQPRKIRQSLAQQDQLIAFAQRSRFPANRIEHHGFTAIEPDEKARLQFVRSGRNTLAAATKSIPTSWAGTGTRYISLASRRTDSSS